MIPWGDERIPARPGPPPWPGRLPAPAPAKVLGSPVRVMVYDAAGAPVEVSGRLEVSAPPARIVIGSARRGQQREPQREQSVEVIGWIGPWPVDERWWAPEESRRRARFQAALPGGWGLLLSLAGGIWSVEAVYD
jgi:protein ImuB